MPVGNGLVGWWNMDESSGTSAADSSGNGNTGTLTNSPTWTTSGKYNGALTLANASNNYVDVANPANFNFERTNAFSIAAWVYRTGTTTEGNIVSHMIFNSGHWPGYSFAFLGDGSSPICNTATCTTNCLEVDLNYFAASNAACIEVNGSAATPNAWHHVAMTYDGSSTAAGIHIYVDGVLQTVSNSLSALTSSIQVATDIKIGTDVPGNGDSFSGTIDDVRIYNRALSAAEIARLYNGAP